MSGQMILFTCCMVISTMAIAISRRISGSRRNQ